jgi:hypothetical protein
MCENKRFIHIVVIVACVGFVNTDSNGAVPIEFEGRFGLNEPLTVGIATGTTEHPELVRIEWIRFERKYANSSGVTARVGWLPVEDATWRLAVELLDEEGRILRYSRDEPAVFTGNAGMTRQTDMRYADLDLGYMHDQGRRHAARFRVRLEPSEKRIAEGDTHTLEVTVVDLECREPISDATVVVSSSYLKDTFWRRGKILCITDSQGRCRVKLARAGLALIGVSAQKQDYCTIAKSWSNSGSWGLGRAPLVSPTERYVLEMVRASALGGIVQDTEGTPIAGAEVHLDIHVEEPCGIMYINRIVRTDPEGRWRMDGIPGDAERMTLQVRHPDYGGNNGINRHIHGDELVNAWAFKYVVTLDKGITITGRVLDERGESIDGATVMLAQQSYNAVYSLTDTSGAFRLVCSSDPSAYREAPALIVEAPGYAPVQQAIDLQPEPKPLEFRLEPGRNVACRVVDTKGQPVVGAWTVVDPLPNYRDYSVWLGDTDEQGEFHIPNVPKNDVKVTIGKQGCITVRDHVMAASEDEVVVTMKRAMRIHGTVTDAVSGKPMPHFEIAAVITSGGRTRTGGSPIAFAEGTYEISSDEARPETRQFQVSAVGYEPAISDQIEIDEGERTLDFKLTRSASFDVTTAGRPREEIRPTGPRRIAGMVRDGQGKPVPNAVVRTCPMRGIEAVSNAKGGFSLKMRSTSNSMGSMRREEITYLLVRQKERNLGVAVELDTSTDTVNVTMAPGAILSGKVVDAEGKGIPSAELSLTFWTSSIGYGMPEVTKIDEAGHYEIRAVPPGQRYSVRAKADGYGERYVQVDTGGAANERIKVEPLVLSVANLSASGIVVDDFDQPVSGIRIYAYGNGQPSRETFTDSDGRFTIENICPGPLSIQANSQRQAPRRFRGRARAEGGAADIKIVVSELDERGRPVPSRPPSLVGKPLPELKDIGIKLSPTDIEGKKILVCFWDMNQRPSRHCMTQLAKQIETLEKRDVIVVAVQASKVDRNTLDEWVKKYHVPFFAMIEGDAKKIRFSFGVQSLPWLILSDSQHLVVDAGFGLSELADKIEAAK